MKTYSVFYRRFGTKKWIEIPNVVADGQAGSMPHRYFLDKDGVHFEVPFGDMEFKFTKERAEIVKEMSEASKGKAS